MGTHYKGTPAEVNALNAFIALVRAAESVSARAHAHLTEAGLTEGQFGVLEVLLHKGPLCQKELGKKLLRTSGNMTVVVDNLEKHGFVRRERDRQDRRMVTIHLTNAGHERIARLFPKHVAIVAAEMGVLTRADQNALRRLCRIVGTGNRTETYRHTKQGEKP